MIFKLSVVWAGVVAAICILFGVGIGYEVCSIVNNVPGLKERVNDLESVSVQVNEESRKSAIKVEEQLVTTEQMFEELRKSLNELKHRTSQASDKILDKVEAAGKSIEETKKSLVAPESSSQ